MGECVEVSVWGVSVLRCECMGCECVEVSVCVCVEVSVWGECAEVSV